MDGNPDSRGSRTANLTPCFALSEMTESDLDQILILERESFPTPWTREGFLTAIRTDFGRGWVVLDRDREERSVVGYLCCWTRRGTIQVVNICVAQSHRGRGLGRLLMQVVISWAGIKNKKRVSLEVRPGNLPAINLYQNLGFRHTGSRAGYYSDTGEEAFLYELRLDKVAESFSTRPPGSKRTPDGPDRTRDQPATQKAVDDAPQGE